jgi:hypothetical protein
MRSGVITLTLLTILGAGAQARAQSIAQASGRLSFFGSSQTLSFDDGTSRDFQEVTAALVLHARIDETVDGLEYAIDVRETQYPSAESRKGRTRLYDAWAGGRFGDGRFRIRAGQMWLHEFGALGSVGGVMTEYRANTAAGRLRFGLFGGAEPKSFDAGYVSGVRKGGAWIALDGNSSRRHVLGFVTTRHSGLTERSVLTTTNFLPLGKKLFVYQLAEYDIRGAGGVGEKGLNYFFANVRYTPASRFELLATVHRGRSIDARTITDNILNGRPVDQKTLDGYLFESAGGRVTVAVTKTLRIHAGYAKDRHNRDDRSFDRISAGLWASNIARSGFDLTVSDHRSDRPDGSYDAWYASLGRSFGRNLYVTADYATSLAIVRVADGGAIIERRPESKRYGLSAVWNMTRIVSLLTTIERLDDDTSTDERLMVGLIYRF